LVGNLGYRIEYGAAKTFATSISLFYAGRSGTPLSYIYNGDINGDGAFTNDLIYIPRTQSEIRLLPLAASGSNPALTPAQQWDALNSFIANDPYLNSRRGQYAERNGAETPWQHQFDARIAQDLGGLIKGTKNRVQLTFDVFNIGNLINKDWGRQYFVFNQTTQLITYSTSSGGGFTFRAPADNYQTSGTSSAWSGQFGVRYLFN
jgi:hypothetical protein